MKSIEADRYFDMPGYLDRADIEAKCVDMAGNYYGKVERPDAGGRRALTRHEDSRPHEARPGHGPEDRRRGRRASRSPSTTCRT